MRHRSSSRSPRSRSRRTDPATPGTARRRSKRGVGSPRKRTLWATYGVGTVDQALLAALSVRHGFVRLTGLAAKVVLIDEVHAYDVYMSSIIERLLAWLAALGTPIGAPVGYPPRLPAPASADGLRRRRGRDRGTGRLPAPEPRLG